MSQTVAHSRALGARSALWCLGLAGFVLALGCSYRPAASTGLHYIDDTLVYSQPPDHRAYAAYLEARLLMESQTPDFERAWEAMERALYYDRRDPHLWTARGELAMMRGELDVAFTSTRRALELRPGYPPARALIVELRTRSQGTKATARAGTPGG